jgi:hypothetical protein
MCVQVGGDFDLKTLAHLVAQDSHMDDVIDEGDAQERQSLFNSVHFNVGRTVQQIGLFIKISKVIIGVCPQKRKPMER